jgi:PAS domain-containing protein
MKKQASPTKTAKSKEPASQEIKEKQAPPERKVFPVVGIGASAGGLEPLEAFFAFIPADRPDLAFVVIQHLSPQHKSIIGEILKKDTDMPIKEIKNGMRIEPNTIYFNPPDQEVGLYQGAFQLMEPAEARHVRLPIDAFFRSLAQDLEKKAICIVLSGTGSDGTLGLEAVKSAGGMTMAQAEEQAKYPFMPRSAIDTGLVDFVLPVEKMPEEIIRYVRHPYLEDREKELPGDRHYQSFLKKVLMLVRANTKHDFSHYKQTTIRRRVGRRMAVHKIQDIADYFRYLQQNPGEIQTLFKDLVICVTSFFRDPEAFQALEAKVVQEILKNKGLDRPIRVWESTNEELQSTNEELETAKEELQSTNEELVTVNSELNNKIDELTEINDDITNLLASTEVGTIFLDQNLGIKRFTPAATRLFSLIPSDVGRSIKDITPKTEYGNLWQDAENVLRSLQVKEIELKSLTGETFVVRLLPYRTRDNLIDGVVVTFIDISAQHLLGMARNFAGSIADTVREPLLILNGELKVVSANQAFYRNFQTTKAETEHRPIYELGAGQWDIPRLRELLDKIIPRNAAFNDFAVEHDFPKIGHKAMLLNARRLPAAGEHPQMILLAIEDYSERLAKEHEYQESIDRLKEELAKLKAKG